MIVKGEYQRCRGDAAFVIAALASTATRKHKKKIKI